MESLPRRAFGQALFQSCQQRELQLDLRRLLVLLRQAKLAREDRHESRHTFVLTKRRAVSKQLSLDPSTLRGRISSTSHEANKAACRNNEARFVLFDPTCQ